jgi:choline-sulfatase
MLLLMGFLACSRGSDHVQVTLEHPSSLPLRKDGPDVVLIVLDTLRADHLTQYGYPEATSPGLDRLAASSTRFNHAYSTAPWTVPATTSILTGQHPLRHGMRRAGDVLPDATTTLAERVRAGGWETAAWSYNVSVAPKHGHDQGFDAFTSNTGKVLAYPHAGRMTSTAATWLNARPDQPSFVYLQPMNCHGPYKVPTGRQETLLGRAPSRRFSYYGPLMRSILKQGDLNARDSVSQRMLTSLREQYDTAIRYETDEVGKLIASMQAAGRYDGALVILTSDHGEELFDHGGFSHGYSLHDEVLHVPLFVKLPGQKEGREVDADVSTLDIPATILDVLGLSAPELDGRSLRAAAAGEPIAPGDQLYDVNWPSRIVAQGYQREGWKLIHTRSDYQGLRDHTSLFHLREDPDEDHDLASTEPDRVAALAALLETAAAGLLGTEAPKNVLSDMDRDQLEALGYLE